MKKFEGHGGMSAGSVLGSGLMGNKGVAAAMAMDFVKGRKHWHKKTSKAQNYLVSNTEYWRLI